MTARKSQADKDAAAAAAAEQEAAVADVAPTTYSIPQPSEATPAAIRTPAIADGSSELPAVMTPTQVVELKRLAGVEIAPGGVLDAVTGGKIRTVLRAASLGITSFLGLAELVPGRVIGLIIAGLTAAELALYTLVKGAQQ